MNDFRCMPNGIPFDREGNPRERYSKVMLDGTYCIVKLGEVASIIGDDDQNTYVVTDIFLSRQELEALPEFTGF
jgi:hypothetical protein